MGFVLIYPMRSKREFPEALHHGVPTSLVVDPSGEQTSRKVRRFCHQVGTTLRILEESTQWANRAEQFDDDIKKKLGNSLAWPTKPLPLDSDLKDFLVN